MISGQEDPVLAKKTRERNKPPDKRHFKKKAGTYLQSFQSC